MTAIGNILERYWKPLTLIGIIILVAGTGLLAFNQVTKGSFIERNIELIGGKQIEIVFEGSVDLTEIRNALPEANVQLITGLRPALLIEVPTTADENAILAELSNLGVTGEPTVRSIGPLLGELFFKQTQLAIAIAFIFMAIVIFILFRTLVPSIGVVLAALTDIVATLAVLDILGVKLSLAVLAGVLMLIGYSVDTDIVLTTEMVKHKEGVYRTRVKRAFKTGITMTIASIAALVAMFFASGSVIIQEIALVLVIGLIIDLPVTWFTNAGILRLWLERRDRKKGEA